MKCPDCESNLQFESSHQMGGLARVESYWCNCGKNYVFHDGKFNFRQWRLDGDDWSWTSDCTEPTE